MFGAYCGETNKEEFVTVLAKLAANSNGARTQWKHHLFKSEAAAKGAFTWRVQRQMGIGHSSPGECGGKWAWPFFGQLQCS